MPRHPLDLTQLQREFLDASLAAEQAEQRKETRRRRKLKILAASMAFLATVSFYFFWDSKQKASDLAAALKVAQRNESRTLTAFAEQEITRLNYTTARNLALAALPISLINPDRAFVPEALAALYRAVYHGRELAVLEGHQGAVWSAVFDPAGALVPTASWDQTARLCKVLPCWGEALIEHVRATLPRELTDRSGSCSICQLQNE